jgi:Transposase DDE domain
VITDGGGIPLAASLTGGNRNDITQLLPLIEAIPAIAGTRGRPRHRPGVVYADRAYDHDKYRRLLRAKGIGTRIARRGQPHGSGLGTIRWVVERTHRLVPRLPPPAHPMGTPRRHPRSLPRPRHLHHHLQAAHRTLLGPLKPSTRLPPPGHRNPTTPSLPSLKPSIPPTATRAPQPHHPVLALLKPAIRQTATRQRKPEAQTSCAHPR